MQKLYFGVAGAILSAALMVYGAGEAVHSDDHSDHDTHEAAVHEEHAEIHDDHDGHDHTAEAAAAVAKTVHTDDHSDHAAEEAAVHEEHAAAEDDHNGHDHAAETAAPAGEAAPPLQLTPAQRQAVNITRAVAAPGSIDRSLRLYGELFYDPAQVAKVMPRLPGFVARIDHVAGDRVRAGEVLAVLKSYKLGEMYSDYHSAVQLEALNASEFERNQRLYAQKAVAERELIRSEREYADARIQRQRAEELLRALDFDPEDAEHAELHGDVRICTTYEIVAPIDGTVIAADITLGENFPEDNERPIFVIANNAWLYLDLKAPQEDLGVLRSGLPVRIEVQGMARSFSGSIVYIAPEADPATRLTLVRVKVPNPDGALRPGFFATGIIALEAADVHTVLVPRRAVQTVDGENVVFVPEGEGFRPVPVRTGRANRHEIEITAGLEPGESYISNGAFELKSAMLMSGADAHAGHGH